MSGIAADAPVQEAAAREAEQRTTVQAGAASFSDLVRAHFRREEERKANGTASKDAQDDYAAKLEAFEREEGRLEAVYWSTRDASAVALTVGRARGGSNPLAETETKVGLHRVTDWVTKDASQIADLLHECDLLAIRVREILRGTSERITMRWIYAVQAHLIGFFERTDDRGGADEQSIVEAQRKELMKIEEYYLRTAAKAGRIVYVSGMLIGAVGIVGLCAVVAGVVAGAYPAQWGAEVQILLLCTGAGAVGALVSVLSRMSGGNDKFSVDFEVGRPLLRRLGLYKPLVGSVFGVALYFLLASGLLMTEAPDGEIRYFYGIVAFFAGFSERFTGVIFGGAQRLISGESDDDASPATRTAGDPATPSKATEA
jgi:gluconate kinase